MPTRRGARRPRADAHPALRSVTLIPVSDGRLVVLGPDRGQRAVFASPSAAGIYIQCLVSRLEYEARQNRATWEAKHGPRESSPGA